MLSEYSFTSSDSNVKVSKSGNKLTITSKKAIDGKARITATRNNTPTVSSGAMMIAYGVNVTVDVFPPIIVTVWVFCGS